MKIVKSGGEIKKNYTSAYDRFYCYMRFLCVTKIADRGNLVLTPLVVSCFIRVRCPRFTSNNCADLFDISLDNIYDDYSVDAIYYFLVVVDIVIHNHVQNVRARANSRA